MLLMRPFASLVPVPDDGRRGFGVNSMRRSVVLASLLLLVGGSTAPARVSAVPPGSATFLLTGHGWGHGVGMSQYGAYGYAQHGFGYAKILAHYFPGTELGAPPVSRLRVLLTSGAATLKIGSTDDFAVRDSSGATHDVAAGT